MVTMFSNFQAIFPLTSPNTFGILATNFATKVKKYDLTFVTKIRVGLKTFVGMMLEGKRILDSTML